MKAKEFLGQHEIDHRSVNAQDGGSGEAIHAQLGRPPVPSLVVDGDHYPLLHMTQIVSILGLDLPTGIDTRTTRVAYDCITILESWLELLDRIPFATMIAPTPLRGRSVRNITTEMFHLFALLPTAWETGALEWHTKETNQRREEPLVDAEAVRSFARAHLTSFQSFVLDHEEVFEEQDPWVVTTARGELPFSALMDSQRTHVAVHQRQLVTHLDECGTPTEGILDVEGIADLELPEAIY